MHPALEELGWTAVIDELNDAARLKNQSGQEPILITTNGTLLAGVGRWKLALLKGEKEIPCIEYPRSEDEALQFILEHHFHEVRAATARNLVKLAEPLYFPPARMLSRAFCRR
jgi:hypothetical protein